MGRILAIFVLLSSAFAQPAPSTTREIYIEVLDSKTAQAVDAVSSANFEVMLKGKPVTVLAAERRTIRPRVAIVLDTSGSMFENHQKWADAFELTDGSVRMLAEMADVSLVVMGDKVIRVVPSREGARGALQQLQDLFAGKDPKFGRGRTRLRDALTAAIKTQHLRTGDAIIAVTDGGENSSNTSEHLVESLFASSGVRLFGLMPKTTYYTPREEQQDAIAFTEFAQNTGGFSEPIERATFLKVEDIVSRVASAIVKPCILKLDIPEDASGKLFVGYRRDGGLKLNQGVQVYAPKRLVSLIQVEDDATKK